MKSLSKLKNHLMLKLMRYVGLFFHAENKIHLFQARHQDLEKSIRSCTVKINFEKSDELLSRINADNDTIYIKLASNLEVSAFQHYLPTKIYVFSE